MTIATIPRLYTALAQWLSCGVFILSYQRRGGWKRLTAIAVTALLALTLELELTGDVPLALWIPAMIGSMALMLLFLHASIDASTLTVSYICVRAFILSEFMASLAWQLYSYYGSAISGAWAEPVFVLTVFALVTALALLLERAMGDGRLENVSWREFISALCIGIMVFVISNLSFVSSDTPFSSSLALEIYNIRTFVDFGGVAVLMAYHLQHRELRMRYELDAIQNVLETQYAQYKQSRESIEIVNRKYHDLKHQIAALRAEEDPAVRAKWLDAMEDDIRTYEAQNKTGNSVLDTVLTAKSLYCQKHAINLTSVVDGGALKFMDAMDICTIFGNALDNAIEAVLRLEDKQKRLINLTVSSQKGFVLINVENYYEGELQYQGQTLLTTKGDAAYHGYGVKSIRYSAQRYGGTVSISTEKNWFALRILIPQG